MKRLLILLAAMLMLAACGNKEKEPEKTTELVPYTDDTGEIMIPKNPQRVIILNNSLAGYPFALDEKPIALTDFAYNNTHFKPYIDGIENIGDEKAIEKVLELKPDLIIGYSTLENIKEYEKIAPVVSFDYGIRDFREQLLAFGDIYGKQDVAQQWLDEWDERIAEDKDDIQQKLGEETVAILGVSEKSAYAYSDRWGRSGEIIYGEFGLKAPDAVQKQAIEGEGWAELSLETLPEFAGDHIFLEDGPEAKNLKNLEIWQSLPAVKNNNIYFLDTADSYFNDPISLEGQRKFVVKTLLGDK